VLDHCIQIPGGAGRGTKIAPFTKPTTTNAVERARKCIHGGNYTHWDHRENLGEEEEKEKPRKPRKPRRPRKKRKAKEFQFIDLCSDSDEEATDVEDQNKRPRKRTKAKEIQFADICSDSDEEATDVEDQNKRPKKKTKAKEMQFADIFSDEDDEATDVEDQNKKPCIVCTTPASTTPFKNCRCAIHPKCVGLEQKATTQTRGCPVCRPNTSMERYKKQQAQWY
jgi:hypothetical protein